MWVILGLRPRHKMAKHRWITRIARELYPILDTRRAVAMGLLDERKSPNTWIVKHVSHEAHRIIVSERKGIGPVHTHLSMSSAVNIHPYCCILSVEVWKSVVLQEIELS